MKKPDMKEGDIIQDHEKCVDPAMYLGNAKST